MELGILCLQRASHALETPLVIFLTGALGGYHHPSQSSKKTNKDHLTIGLRNEMVFLIVQSYGLRCGPLPLRLFS